MDLNSDVGESFGRWTLGDDAAVLAVVTSANVACGFHAGDPSTLARTCSLAVDHDARIGAQVSYRDLAGFGRRFVDADPGELRDDVVYQVGGLQALARAAGDRVRYLKPHGALYHAAGHHHGHAEALVAAVTQVDPTLPVVGPPGSLLLRLAAEAGLATVREAFADRAYAPDGTLVARSRPGAVLTDPAAVTERVRRLALDGEVVAVDGSVLPLEVDSICVHGDTPGAVDLAVAVRAALEQAGVTPRAFT